MSLRRLLVTFASACAMLCAFLFARPAEARGNFWLVVDSSNEASLHCSSMLEDFWACVLNATNFDDVVAHYTGSTLRPVQPLDFGGATIVDAHKCGNPDAPGWEPMLQCVIDTAKITVAEGDYVLYIPPTGGWDARNCTICYVNSGGKRVSIRGAFNQSGKCDGFTFGSIHETFEANTFGGSDDCCNGYYAGGVKEASSCVSMFGATAGETTMKCGYKSDWHVQRITHGPRSDGTFYGEDCFLVKETAAPGSPESVCMLQKTDRLKGKCIGGNVVTCEYKPTPTTCTDGCFEDSTGAHCVQFDATCSVSAPPSACGGESAHVVVTCKNTGNQAWDANLEIVAVGSSSPLATVSPTSVAPSASGTFSFDVHAPFDGKLVLQEKGASAPHAKPVPITLSIAAEPCGDASPADAEVDASSDAGPANDMNGAGCACSTPRGDDRSSNEMFFAAFVALAWLTRSVVGGRSASRAGRCASSK